MKLNKIATRIFLALCFLGPYQAIARLDQVFALKSPCERLLGVLFTPKSKYIRIEEKADKILVTRFWATDGDLVAEIDLEYGNNASVSPADYADFPFELRGARLVQQGENSPHLANFYPWNATLPHELKQGNIVISENGGAIHYSTLEDGALQKQVIEFKVDKNPPPLLTNNIPHYDDLFLTRINKLGKKRFHFSLLPAEKVEPAIKGEETPSTLTPEQIARVKKADAENFTYGYYALESPIMIDGKSMRSFRYLKEKTGNFGSTHTLLFYKEPGAEIAYTDAPYARSFVTARKPAYGSNVHELLLSVEDFHKYGDFIFSIDTVDPSGVLPSIKKGILSWNKQSIRFEKIPQRQSNAFTFGFGEKKWLLIPQVVNPIGQPYQVAQWLFFEESYRGPHTPPNASMILRGRLLSGARSNERLILIQGQDRDPNGSSQDFPDLLNTKAILRTPSITDPGDLVFFEAPGAF